MADSRSKGARFENTVAKMLGDAYSLNLRRTPQSGGWSRGAEEVAGDLVCVDKEYDLQYCVECKKQEGWNMDSLLGYDHIWFDNWWRQCKSATPNGKDPLLVFSRNYAPVYAASNYDVMLGYPYPRLLTEVDGEMIIVCQLEDFLEWDIAEYEEDNN